MGHKIIESTYTKTVDDKLNSCYITMSTVFILADDENSIPEVEDNWEIGSFVFIADTQNVKVLNTEREWV